MPSAERVVEAATKQFAEAEGFRDWKFICSDHEVEAMDLETELETRSQAARPGSYAQKTPLQRRA